MVHLRNKQNLTAHLTNTNSTPNYNNSLMRENEKQDQLELPASVCELYVQRCEINFLKCILGVFVVQIL